MTFVKLRKEPKTRDGEHSSKGRATPSASHFCYSTKQGEKRIWCGHNIRICQRKRERARCGKALRRTIDVDGAHALGVGEGAEADAAGDVDDTVGALQRPRHVL